MTGLTVLKLLAHPALVFVLLYPVLGAPLAITAIAVTIAAMSVADNVFVIAGRYGA